VAEDIENVSPSSSNVQDAVGVSERSDSGANSESEQGSKEAKLKTGSKGGKSNNGALKGICRKHLVNCQEHSISQFPCVGFVVPS
jgi:hypothetical protein